MLKTPLTTTILAGAIMLSTVAFAQSDRVIATEAITHNGKEMDTNNGMAMQITDPRLMAERFLTHVNSARVSIALNDGVSAKQHIGDARELVAMLKNVKNEDRKIFNIQSGRLVYNRETKHRDYFLPIDKIETRPVEVKKVRDGSIFRHSKGLAVTDAEMVYLSVDLSNDKAEKALETAWKQLQDNKAAKAQATLEELISNVVSIDAKVEVPFDKAVDNIALARTFIGANNYDGARYALKYADKALDAMEKDDNYLAHRSEVKTLRNEVVAMQDILKRNDPTAIEKADIKLKKLWTNLKSWTKK
jgi:hypothetical protein